ncbi:uncharacterized protein LOC141893102 isoform X4 [Acropora palmata]|uniref:uncharacterized protein LOC141893102 isoform X4 n=1 Tax=Acropora palmata TaxID=6131 RepID=UPI003DA15C09
MAASLDEKIAEAVRRFPVLYDKSCKDFKDNNTKKNAWEDVAKIAGLSSGNEGSEDDDTQNVDEKSDTTETTTSDADNHPASNFRPTKKPKL